MHRPRRTIPWHVGVGHNRPRATRPVSWTRGGATFHAEMRRLAGDPAFNAWVARFSATETVTPL